MSEAEVYKAPLAEGGSVSVRMLDVDGSAGIVAQSNALPAYDEEAKALERAGALAPPYPPQMLATIYETSTALRPAIEAIQENVHGHGHRLEPILDLDKPATREVVREAMMFERALRVGGLRAARFDRESLLPSEIDVDIRMSEIRTRMIFERFRVEALFSACCPGSDLVLLRKKICQDYEVTGNAYLGILRDNAGDVAEFEHLRSVSMRLRPILAANGAPLRVPIQVPVRKTPITIDYATHYASFRSYAQLGLTRSIYFKQYGDPRLMSARTGHLLDSEDELQGAAPATEVYHLAIPSLVSEYGVPRWIAAAPVVHGLRASQEVNAEHFDNNAIPRMLFLISGGTIKDDAHGKLSDLLRKHSKGRDNYGSCVVVQATPASTNPNGRVTIEAKPLKEAIPDDGLFLNYGGRCRDEVLSQFRLPRFVTGQLDDVNRSTAEEGLAFVEDQVFQPLRYAFDVAMNAILQAEGVLYWRFVSNSPISRDPETSASITETLAKAGGLSLNDVRQVAAEIQNRPYVPFDFPGADLPLELAKVAFFPPVGAPQSLAASKRAPAGDAVAEPVAKAAVRTIASPRDLVDFLVAARDQLERGAAESFAGEYATQKGNTLVIALSGDELAEMVDFA